MVHLLLCFCSSLQAITRKECEPPSKKNGAGLSVAVMPVCPTQFAFDFFQPAQLAQQRFLPLPVSNDSKFNVFPDGRTFSLRPVFAGPVFQASANT